MSELRTYDVVVVGGGPAGATAATDLALEGRSVLLLDRAGRIKPCGGAIPPKLIEEFEIPDSLLVAKINSARMVAPGARQVDMPIVGGFVGMVDRDVFDEWLRERAVKAGAERRDGTFETLTRDGDGTAIVHYRPKGADPKDGPAQVRARSVIGADGAISAVAREAVPDAGRPTYVFAYHEIIRSPQDRSIDFDPTRCDVVYRGTLSPDFYSWVFPHGATTSVGTGTAHKGFSMKGAVATLREECGLDGLETLRREGAPLPLKPLRKWDNGRDVVLAGDAAGVVAPSSGEGIYYAMVGGRVAAEAVQRYLATGDSRQLATARRRFMRLHGRVFWILEAQQNYWYASDSRREHFVSMCRDKELQRLIFQSYMYKKLVWAKPLAHLRIFLMNLAYMVGLKPA